MTVVCIESEIDNRHHFQFTDSIFPLILIPKVISVDALGNKQLQLNALVNEIDFAKGDDLKSDCCVPYEVLQNDFSGLLPENSDDIADKCSKSSKENGLYFPITSLVDYRSIDFFTEPVASITISGLVDDATVTSSGKNGVKLYTVLSRIDKFFKEQSKKTPLFLEGFSTPAKGSNAVEVSFGTQ